MCHLQFTLLYSWLLAQDLKLVEKSEWNTVFRLEFPVAKTKIALLVTVQPKFPDIFFFVNGEHVL